MQEDVVEATGVREDVVEATGVQEACVKRDGVQGRGDRAGPCTPFGVAS